MKYQLTVEAAKDVEEILAYSVNSFGAAQHVVFYKKLSSSILVVRILHERMDPKLHLKK